MLIKLPRLKGSLVVLRSALSDENASSFTIPSNEPKRYVYCGNWDTLSHFDCKLLFVSKKINKNYNKEELIIGKNN